MVAEVETPPDPQFSTVILPGLYTVKKPPGPAAFSVVAETKTDWPVCHGGALDPFAEGLMLVLVGPATKLFPLLHAAPKRYLATVQWGVETDNGDLLGAPIAQGDASALTPAALDAALPPMLGWTDQVPPRHSNKRVGGERAWVKARRGDDFELPPSRVYLHSARWVSHALPASSVLEVVCRGGYYVRALARDLGRALGARAHLSALNRTDIGPWSCPRDGARAFVCREGLLPWLPARRISDDEKGALKRDGRLPAGETRPGAWAFPAGFPPADPPAVRVFHQEKLVAVLGADGAATLVFRPGL